MTGRVVRVVPDQIYALRHRVLRADLPPESAHFEHDHDAVTAHFAVLGNEGSVIGCVTIHPAPLDAEPAWRLRGMAVDPAAQTGGIGRRLLTAIDEHVRTADGLPKLLWCHARLPAVGFYERCGWTAVTGVYDIPTAGPHRTMVRRLEASPRMPTVTPV